MTSTKDGASSSLEMVTPPVITLTAARSGRNHLHGRVLGAKRLVDSREVFSWGTTDLGYEADPHVGAWGWGVCGTETDGWYAWRKRVGSHLRRCRRRDRVARDTSICGVSCGSRVKCGLLRVLENLFGGVRWEEICRVGHTGFCTLNSLTFLCKPGSDTPRPIRVGDHLRRLIGMRLFVKFGARIKKVMLGFLQFGVAVLGGVEASQSMRGALWRRWHCVMARSRWLWWKSTSSIFFASECSSSLQRWTLWGNTCLNWTRS